MSSRTPKKMWAQTISIEGVGPKLFKVTVTYFTPAEILQPTEFERVVFFTSFDKAMEFGEEEMAAWK